MSEEHSRHDKNHYTRCKECLEDHMDFLQELELDAVEDMKESEGGQCE